MDITLLNASVFSLPSSHRADVIVHGGPRDLSLWRPPGPDRDLLEAYGEDLQQVLDKERDGLEGSDMGEAGVARIHPGKLHCDFLLLCATREAHGEEAQSNAPDEAHIELCTRNALEFIGRVGVTRVAIPALGAGPESLDAPGRLAAVVRAADAYKQACFKDGRATGIDEIIVCDPSSTAVTRTKRLVTKLAKAAAAPAKKKKATKKATKKRATARSKVPKLDPEDVAEARASADAYDRTRTYIEEEWFMHPKFGAGQVQEVDPEGRVKVLYEDGKERTMLHARA